MGEVARKFQRRKVAPGPKNSINGMKHQPKMTKAKVTKNMLDSLANETNRIRLYDRAKLLKGKAKSAAETTAGRMEVDEADEVVLSPFQEPVLPPGVEDIDEDDCDDPQLVSENVSCIYSYLRELESGGHQVPDGFLRGSRINPRMRGVLINWLHEVHLQFKLLLETMFLTVHLVDRFLSLESARLKPKTLQLVGVSAMLIASKYEEMFSPEVGDFVYITDNTYDSSQVLSMELEMLRALNFELGAPLSINFLRRFSKAGMVDVWHHTMAKYILELCLTDYELASAKPSLMAAASLLLSMKMESPGNSFGHLWSPNLRHYSCYGLDDLRPTVRKISLTLLGAESTKLQSARLKYQSASRLKVSFMPEASLKLLAELVDDPRRHVL